MNDLPMDMNMTDIAGMLRDPSAITKFLTEANPQTGESPAEIAADVINVQRADVKKLAEQRGVDIEISLMTPERAAEWLAGTVDGGVELLLVFNEIEDKRNRILRETMNDDEHDQYLDQKRSILHTEPAE